ncbi:ComEA family DNA-binding protein [Pseudoalteromonas denitrificans]|uniref:Competence protein ComEA n=1 Tax=Pseudoalteromonas denitrificans DSM 6059 TaxID=1123010 RepID=A0A1I1TVY7_9GAMM|nr:ComEA family DNA-binding protein [Pseudoalteromonas denitrificans]SFD62674.1 competence protein ComEA [Pseudoalteromonas denitrificans DSM 6059]
MKFNILITLLFTFLLSVPLKVIAQNNKDKTVVVHNQLINLNTAKQKEIESLPGIGKSKAAAIISYRNKNGQFKSIEDLVKVGGLGKTIITKLEGKIRF